MGSPWDPRVVPAQPAPPGPECTELPGPNSTQNWEPTAETPQHTAIGPRLYGTRPISNSAPTDPTAVETHSLHLWPGCRGAGRHLRASHRWKPDPRPPPSPPSGFTFPRPAVSVSRQNAVRCGEGRCGGGPTRAGGTGAASPPILPPPPQPPPVRPRPAGMRAVPALCPYMGKWRKKAPIPPRLRGPPSAPHIPPCPARPERPRIPPPNLPPPAPAGSAGAGGSLTHPPFVPPRNRTAGRARPSAGTAPS